MAKGTENHIIVRGDSGASCPVERAAKDQTQIGEVHYAASVLVRNRFSSNIGLWVWPSPTSDSRTLEALLSEVRTLRQDLRVSLNRTQAMQILLVRFQMQETAVARASERTNEARQKLLDTHVHQKELTADLKRVQDSLDSAQNPQQQADFQDRLKQIKSGIEITGNIAQQQQAEETQAEQHLRDEQDKLGALEGQLDELIRVPDSSTEGSSRTK